MATEEISQQVANAAPELWTAIAEIADRLILPIINNLEQQRYTSSFPKTINDPIWGSIELYPWEVAILDSPLLQRLRGISQLGLAHYVYPGASHCRLEHTLGVLETSDRMMRALERNAENHRNFGVDKDTAVPTLDTFDRRCTRLGALLHDIGHGPFSHVTETLLRSCAPADFENAANIMRQAFDGVGNIAAAELISVLLVFSNAARIVFEHPKFDAVADKHRLQPGIAARILGSRSHLKAGYLSGVISGPIDADKIDYMARDSHHSGFPVGLDFNRLISKLEVIIVTPENAPNPELRQRAQHAGGRVYEMGISLSGLGAYEQMVIGRVLLYDRLYFHHKVRAAEAMLRKLMAVAEEESSHRLTLTSYFEMTSETDYISVWSGLVQSEQIACGGPRAKSLGDAIRSRRIYNRAFAFASRFITGLESLPEQEATDTRQLLWDVVMDAFGKTEDVANFTAQVLQIAQALRVIDALAKMAATVESDHILVDFPVNKTTVRGNDILTRTESGQVVPPNLFFDPEKWSQAYEHQKLVGHVFAPREYVSLIATASKIAFFERFEIVMGQQAENAAKVAGVVRPEWISEAANHGVCSPKCAEVLLERQGRFVRIRTEEIAAILPDAWRSDAPGLASLLSNDLNNVIPGGLPAGAHDSVIHTLADLVSFVHMSENAGTFVARQALTERELQTELKKHLLSRGSPVQEGAELGGGETDLIAHRNVLIENKVRDATRDPFEVGANYGYQARRYAIAMVQRIGFVVIAYQPRDESAILPLTDRIRISRLPDVPDNYAEIRVVIPSGMGVPSSARAPDSRV